MVLGEMDVTMGELIPVWPGLTPRAHSFVCIPSPSSDHPIPRGGSRFASYLVDDVHQGRITYGVGGIGDDV